MKGVAVLLLLLALSASAPAPLQGSNSLCPTCISLMGQIINELLNIISNAGVIGSCQDLCGKLPNELEQVGCTLLCAAVGLDVFMKAVDWADPDPVWSCMAIDVCGKTKTAAAEITHMTVHPKEGPAHTKFDVEVFWNTTSEIATGEMAVGVNGPGAFDLGDSDLLVDQAPGMYSAKFQFEAKPTKDNPWNKGHYEVEFALCEGSCGSPHSWSYTVAHKTVHFNITDKDSFDYHFYA